MPVSANEREQEPAVPGQSVAVTIEALYLLNLLLLPGLAFSGLVWLWHSRRHVLPSLALCHLKQTLSASVWAAIMLVLVNGVILIFGGYHKPSSWVIVVLYFTTCHTTLVLFGIVGLARAMAGQLYIYPLVGRACDVEHSK